MTHATLKRYFAVAVVTLWTLPHQLLKLGLQVEPSSNRMAAAAKEDVLYLHILFETSAATRSRCI